MVVIVDIPVHRFPELRHAAVLPQVKTFRFQRTEEAFRHGIIQTVSFP